MKNRALAKIGLVCLILLTGAGCVNYEQETYLNPDMSGRLTLHFFFNPRPVIQEALKKSDTADAMSGALQEAASKAKYTIRVKIEEKNILEGFNQDAIRKKSFRKEERDGMEHFYFTVEFDDIKKLFAGKKIVNVVEDKNGLVTYTEYFVSLKDKDKEPAAAGEDTEILNGFTPLEKATDFSRQLLPHKADGGSKPPSALTVREHDSSLTGFTFRYILHLPANIVSANTANIEKNTAVWECPLEEVGKNRDFNVTATFKGENRFKRWLKGLRK